jgi:mitochondrial distribution and morphology protein 31
LAAATGFWSRFKVHFKWFSIRDMRPFNMDDISAFFSWILLGHVVWILVGTTTFFSLCILLINTVFAQETLARWVGNYLTQSSGMQVIFESAIVPKWKNGVISFKNVFVSRRPGQGSSQVSKGSSATAASAAAAAAAAKAGAPPLDETEDTNYTQFDLSIDTVNVTLSFAKWFNGKGLLCDVEIEGVRGVVDRRFVQSAPEGVDPRSYRHEHSPGDFEIESFKLQDLLVTVYQPGDFRPFPVSIYACNLPQLRKQYLFYDLLSAHNMSGSFDNSLFAIHPRQSHNFAGTHMDGRLASDGPMHWKKHQQMRIDGLNIDHLNRGVEGPFSWIHEGNVDIVADVMLPADDDESITKVMSDFYDRVEATVTTNAANAYGSMINNHPDSTEHRINSQANQQEETMFKEPERYLIMDLRVQLNEVRAGVPIFTRDISYVNNALIRPIVAYINSKRTFIPVTCRVVKSAKEFDGSWTIYDSGLLDDLSREVCLLAPCSPEYPC